MEKKSLDICFDFKSVSDGGSFAGYGSVYGVKDVQGDIVAHGAFSESLKSRKPRFLWQHRSDEPIGSFSALREDTHGLYVEGGFLLDVQRGKEAYALVKSGAIEGLSIGYRVIQASFDEEKRARVIEEAELYEISLVTFPANESAGMTQVKADGITTIRDFEGLLRDAGFSRRESVALALHGFKAIESQRDAGEEMTEAYGDILSKLDVSISMLKGNYHAGESASCRGNQG